MLNDGRVLSNTALQAAPGSVQCLWWALETNERERGGLLPALTSAPHPSRPFLGNLRALQGTPSSSPSSPVPFLF